MNKVVRVVGVIVLAILAVSVPVLFGVSIAANWSAYARIWLGFGVMTEICLLSTQFYFEIEMEEI